MAKAPRALVLGTAGHIDHGKTALVHALTGMSTDRLPEEKQRGMTIELGFAAWEITDGLSASIVDVPGHDQFVRTMVAGAGGIDAVLLVVSAEDGVMPQTREHIHVCQLLGVRHAVVALNKVDRLDGDEEAVELARQDVREALTETDLAEAPIIPCSARTAQGLEDLTRAIQRMAPSIPRRGTKGDPILPLDRVFSIHGHGTVVTGTLLGGVIHAQADASLRLEPGGAGRRSQELRIRTAQVHGHAHRRVGAGSRVALNLKGADTRSLSRGDVLTSGHTVARRQVFHAWLRHLPARRAPWTSRTSVQICIGTGYATGALDPLFVEPREDDPVDMDRPGTELAGGREGLVRVRLESPLPIWRGARVVVRAFNDPSADVQGRTVGGGWVLDPHPSAGRAQRRRWVAVGLSLRSEDPRVQMLALVADAGLLGIDEVALAHRLGVDNVRTAVDPLLKGRKPQVMRVSKNRYALASAVRALAEDAIAAVGHFHAAEPLKTGMPKPALEAALGRRVADDVARAAVGQAVSVGALRRVDASGTLARPGQGLSAGGELPPAMQHVLELYARAGTRPPTLREIETALALPATEVLELVSGLQRTGRLIRVNAELSFAKESHETLLAQVRERLHTDGTLDVQALKAMTGLSRKFAVPLLEHLDQMHITLRRGDQRVRGPRA